MFDAANRGWRDNSDVLIKHIVEDRIIPTFNSKLWCNKTYKYYYSQLKWYEDR